MISDTEIQKLQKLARLTFSADEIEGFSNKLGQVLDMIDQLHQAQCDGIAPMVSPCEMPQRIVPDQVLTQDISQELFQNIPQQSAQANFAAAVKCFVVPKMVE